MTSITDGLYMCLASSHLNGETEISDLYERCNKLVFFVNFRELILFLCLVVS
ncbi:hypothetical protein RchiOBHm_Chr4g0445391 [Rosa chinensis]|uniref:Uncharacterized protein n=1 Tax=Rosa chinensis TaxID=74649 RepID=A0A2P6R4G1_ROSCH|nr:hypothetical protein RchiOBHm_Chr4g0445391 [Rosa chinensis]